MKHGIFLIIIFWSFKFYYFFLNFNKDGLVKKSLVIAKTAARVIKGKTSKPDLGNVICFDSNFKSRI